MKPRLKTQTKTKLTTKNIIIIVACVVASVILGFYSGDLLIGSSLVATGFITSYLACLQKRSNFILGSINALLLAYVAFKNNFYGSFIINIFIFAPLEIHGFFAWSRNLDKNKNVKIRKFTSIVAATVVGSCVIGSVLLGYLLTKIPTQQMAFLDSTICCIDICALVIMNLRYRESWWLWVISGALSIVMWATALFSGGDNAFMRSIAPIGFLIINVYGLIKWSIKTRG